jgi:hypothetical protein
MTNIGPAAAIVALLVLLVVAAVAYWTLAVEHDKQHRALIRARIARMADRDQRRDAQSYASKLSLAHARTLRQLADEVQQTNSSRAAALRVNAGAAEVDAEHFRAQAQQ